MRGLLLADILMLIFVVWLATRILRVAADRAKAPRATYPSGEGQASFTGDVETKAETKVIQSWQELPFQVRTPLAAGNEATGDPASDIYADPIDGVPFVTGEEIVVCECGVGYRLDSIDWMSQNYSGKCVQCGSAIHGARRRVA